MLKHFLKKLPKLPKWLLSLTCLCALNAAENKALNFVFVVNPSAKGDLSQCAGFFKRMSAHAKGSQKSFVNEEQLLGNVSSHFVKGKCNVLVFVSSYGLEAIEKISKDATFRKNDWVVVSLSHMFFDKHKDLEGHINLLFIPRHEAHPAKEIYKRKLFTTDGVLHDVTPHTLQAEYEKFKKAPVILNAEKQSGPIVLFMLGGDAVFQDGSMHYFTKCEALAAIKATVKAWPNAMIILTNGPRTGKYDPDTGREIMRGESVDDVSFAVLSWLKKHHKDHFVFEPFKPGQPSKYQALLHVVRLKDGKLVLPGESTSMLSEAKAVITHHNIYVYTHSAMNEGHHAFVEIGKGEGWLAEVGSVHQQTRHWTGYLPTKQWLAAIQGVCSRP